MSNRVSLPLRNLKIASPCPALWLDMDGDDRRRFCHQCSKHVYDFAGLKVDEIDELLGGDARVCGRFYQRADGTVLTADCPIGLRLARTRVGRFVMWTAAFALTVFGVTLTTLAQAEGSGEAFAHSAAMTALQRFTGRVTPPRMVMGDVMIRPTPHGPSR